MFDIQNYLSFVTAILIFQLLPGPGTLAILNATVRGGTSVGLCTVAGTLLGDLIYMIGVMLGLAAVMQAYPVAFEILQWLGATYLCWMGVRLLRSRSTTGEATDGPETTGWSCFRQAFIVGLTNPKVMLFFVAFFPLFLNADASPLTLGVMMAHVTVISFLYQFFLVLTGSTVARALKSLPWVHSIATRLAGLALIGFGLKLAVNNR